MNDISDWTKLSALEKSNWLLENYPACKRSVAYRKPVFGFGINDATYSSQPKLFGVKVRCPAYVAWVDMIRRCNYKKYQDRFPTYKGIVVCNEWRSFSAFRAWWVINHVDGWELDKDILTDSGVYSPRNCIYVPKWLNAFNNERKSARGDLPIGVDFHRGMYRSRCKNPITMRGEHLGYFKCKIEAMSAWMRRKLDLAYELKNEMDSIDKRIYHRIVSIISNAS